MMNSTSHIRIKSDQLIISDAPSPKLGAKKGCQGLSQAKNISCGFLDNVDLLYNV